MQIALNILSVFAFVLSLSSWIHAWITQRRKLRMLASFHLHSNFECHIFHVSFENQSRIPIAISRIYLIIGSNEYECTRYPKKVFETTSRINNEITSHEVYKSLEHPIAIPSLGGASGYIAFEDCQQIIGAPATVATFRLHTNRGRPFEIQVPLESVETQASNVLF